jgi:hypothetical protein
MRLNASVLAVALAAIITGGCAMSTHSIADIKQYPGRYDHRSVSIEGRVTQSFGGPLVPLSYYKVDDGTGELTVVANGPAPKPGSVVRVKGRVGDVASFGTHTFGLHLEQDELTVRHR